MQERRPYSLGTLPYLTYIEPELVTLLCKKAAVTRYVKEGEALYQQGEKSDVLFIIQRGSFKSVWTNQDGKEIILQLSGRGEFLGENSVCEQTRYLTSAIATENARVCVLSREKLEEVIRESPEIALQIICNLGNRLRTLSQEVLDFRVGPTRDRVIKLFSRLAVEHGEICPEGIKINIRLTQYDISCFIGTSRVMVAQIIKQLIQNRRIKRDRQYYILVNQP